MAYGKATKQLDALNRAMAAAIRAGPDTGSVPKRRAYNKVLSNVVAQAAAAVGCEYSQAAMLISHFTEFTAAAVCRGEIVQIRGFGAFFPYARYGKPRRPGAYVMPRFIPASGFRQQVTMSCPVDKAANTDALRYRVNHTRRTGERPTQRVFTAQTVYRRDVAAHARREGELTRFDVSHD